MNRPIVRHVRPIFTRPSQPQRGIHRESISPRRVIQLYTFSGRFGNQLHQYATVRALSEKLNVPFEAPHWIGEEIFVNLLNPAITSKLPRLPMDIIPDRPGNSICGYFQNQKAFDLMKRSKLLQWFRFKPELLALSPKQKPFYIACHLRHGDYKVNPGHFAIIEKEAYIKAVEQYGYNVNDIVWVSEENPGVGSDKFRADINYLADFFTIMQADVIFRANSTFSFWAAALSNAKVYSPNVGDKVGIRSDIEFVEGNHSANLSMKYHKDVLHTDMYLKD